MKEVGTDEVAPDPEENYGVHSRCFQWKAKADGILITQCHRAKVQKN